MMEINWQTGYERIQGIFSISASFPVILISLRLSALCEGQGGGTGPRGRYTRSARESSSLSSCFQSLRGTDGDLPLVLLCFQGCPALTRARVAAGVSHYPAHACSLSPQTETMTARAHVNARTHSLTHTHTHTHTHTDKPSPPPPVTPPSRCVAATQNSA